MKNLLLALAFITFTLGNAFAWTGTNPETGENDPGNTESVNAESTATESAAAEPAEAGSAVVELVPAESTAPESILMGSAAPCNNEELFINGTNDCSSYIVILDSLGNRISQKRMGGASTNVKLYTPDLTGDGKPEVIIKYISHLLPREGSYIAYFDPKTGSIAPKFLLEKILIDDLVFLDANKDGKQDMLLVWQDGSLEIRDFNFDVIQSIELINFFPQRCFTSDLDNDGEIEMLLTGIYGEYFMVLLFDRYLTLLGSFKREFPYKVHSVNVISPGFGKDKLILVNTFEQAFIMEMKKGGFIYKIQWLWLGYGFGGGILLCVLGFIILYNFRRQSTKKHILNTMLKSLNTGALILNSRGRVIAINPQLCRFLDLEEQSTQKRSYHDLFKSSQHKRIEDMITASYQNEDSHIENEISLKGENRSHELLISISSLGIAEQNGPLKLITIKDISDYSQSKRAVAWASMAQKLGHEIKTPLSTVMLSAQRLEMKCQQRPDDYQMYSKYLDNIISQVNRLHHMTDSFLKFAKIEEPQLESVDLNKLIADCVEENRMRTGKDIQIETRFAKELPVIAVDKQQVYIALQNVISNSINAMGTEGVLVVSTRLVQSLQPEAVRGDCCQIEISDSGRGIPEEYMSQLFQPFFSRSPGGTGMGLVLVQKIVEDHRGTVQIKSKFGVGTTVYLNLPL